MKVGTIFMSSKHIVQPLVVTYAIAKSTATIVRGTAVLIDFLLITDN